MWEAMTAAIATTLFCPSQIKWVLFFVPFQRSQVPPYLLPSLGTAPIIYDLWFVVPAAPSYGQTHGEQVAKSDSDFEQQPSTPRPPLKPVGYTLLSMLTGSSWSTALWC